MEPHAYSAAYNVINEPGFRFVFCNWEMGLPISAVSFLSCLFTSGVITFPDSLSASLPPFSAGFGLGSGYVPVEEEHATQTASKTVGAPRRVRRPKSQEIRLPDLPGFRLYQGLWYPAGILFFACRKVTSDSTAVVNVSGAQVSS